MFESSSIFDLTIVTYVITLFLELLTNINTQVQLRNPWGTFEWDGDWSDKSEQWKAYPGVKTELWPNLADNDGCFWMVRVYTVQSDLYSILQIYLTAVQAWDDFIKYYNQIDAIYTGKTARSLVVSRLVVSVGS